MAALRSLAQMPQRFPFLKEAYITPNQYRRMSIEKRYLVLYQIQEDTVYVEYIADCRQDHSWLLPNKQIIHSRRLNVPRFPHNNLFYVCDNAFISALIGRIKV